MRAKVLREKRLNLINGIRAIYGKEEKPDYVWTAADTSEISRMEADLATTEELLGRAEAEERLTSRVGELSAAGPRGATGERDSRIGREDFDARHQERDDDEPTFRDRALAFQAFFKRGSRMSNDMKRACQRLAFDPRENEIDVQLGDEGFIADLANEYRDNSPQAARRAGRALCRHRSIEERELRSMSALDGAAGGYLVPVDFLNRLEENQLAFSGMYQVAEVLRTASGAELPIPTLDDTSNEGEFINEAASVETAADPTMGQSNLYAYKCSSKLIKISSELLEDNAFRLAARIGGLLGTRLARIKNRRFTVGTGVKGPQGLLVGATLGVTAASATVITFDEVLDLEASVDDAYAADGTFMMNKATAVHLRKKKDGQGQYLWQPSLVAGMPDTINAKRVVYNAHFPTLATTNKTVSFGDHSKYMIREAGTLRLRRFDELYGANDQVGFIAFQRVDGKLLDAGTAPVKFIQQA